MKISLLAKNEQFTREEFRTASEFQLKFHKASKTVISFHEVDFSYDQKFLSQVLGKSLITSTSQIRDFVLILSAVGRMPGPAEADRSESFDGKESGAHRFGVHLLRQSPISGHDIQEELGLHRNHDTHNNRHAQRFRRRRDVTPKHIPAAQIDSSSLLLYRIFDDLNSITLIARRSLFLTFQCIIE